MNEKKGVGSTIGVKDERILIDFFYKVYTKYLLFQICYLIKIEFKKNSNRLLLRVYLGVLDLFFFYQIHFPFSHLLLFQIVFR